jgi:small subunit ribosomal protein S21
MDKPALLCYLPRLFRRLAFGRDFRSRGRREPKGAHLVQIFVRDNNVDQALKALKKKMQREGSFREMKRHVHYEKPSEKRARQKAEAVRRARKLARKRAQREGLLPAPKKVVRA